MDMDTRTYKQLTRVSLCLRQGPKKRQLVINLELNEINLKFMKPNWKRNWTCEFTNKVCFD